MKRIKQRIEKVRRVLCTVDFVLDTLFVLGVIVLIATHFMINIIFGMYSIAVFLMGLSIYLANTKKR